MRTRRRLAAAPWAALILTLCAGCDGAPRGQAAAPETSPATSAAERRELAFDRQAPGSANQVPALEGTPGTLRYRPGCLFLDVGGGAEIGLVVPAEVTFDGRRLIGKLPTPDGKPRVREIGQFISFSGPVIRNPGDGRYSCDTRQMLIADYF
ncbi:hypothetical protein [Sphingomonas sp.]|jgi:hypothetical protein|uniref:hypothetical protein n=1 Tax=Sphingomonas sp. TaxID=28214 RepID=UPI002D7EDC0B|nr:hypothetical protein [Sphingomonas sp.]HEU0045151.1 hypothetical protein [Sphingomonas sp.]